MKKGWTIRKDNRLRGAFGETDFDRKIVRVNKKKHRKDSKFKRITPNKDGSENLLNTIQHELVHVNHPKMRERAVEKLARAMKSRMGKKRKAKLYSLVK